MNTNIQFHAFIATSLDGFIADSENQIDWLFKPEFQIPEEDFGYAEFRKTIGAIAMGRKSFETVLGFDPYPYFDLPCYVFTHSDREFFYPDAEVFTIRNGISELEIELQKKGITSVYVDGGQLIQSFLSEAKLNSLTLTQIPILLGGGVTLFSSGASPLQIANTIYTKGFPNGFVQTKYKFKTKESFVFSEV